MRIETNLRLARRSRQIAQYLFFFSFGILIFALFFTNQQFAALNTTDILLGWIIPTAVLIIAFVSTMISVRMTNLWVRAPRPESVLRDGLKGVSNKAVLYNYWHLPARHVLIVPQGVYAIATRFQDGRYTVRGDQWTTHRSLLGRLLSLFRFDSLGNPTLDAQAHAAHVQRLLQPFAPDVTVYPLVVFIDPRAAIEIVDPVVPVVRGQAKLDPSLRDYLRDVGKLQRSSLTTEQIERFEAATLPAVR